MKQLLARTFLQHFICYNIYSNKNEGDDYEHPIYDLSKETLSGITLKSTDLFENGNLALHATENDKQIMKNHEIFTEQLSLTLNYLTIDNQTHSDNFYKDTATDKERDATTMDNAIPNTDALYTDEPGILLGTLTADCVPVTFYDHSKKIVGV